MARALLVEDESDVRELMLLHLTREGIDVVAVGDGKAALKAFAEKGPFDLVVLDWMLPGVSGIELCGRIQGKAPVLMVTARGEPDDVVEGLEAGADDYVTKPFEVPVFLARVRALLRRSAFLQKGEAAADVIRLGKLEVNEGAAEVKCGGKALKLTASEFRLLAALVKNQGRVLSRGKLVEMIQGPGISVVERVIDTHAYTLRKKLGPCAEVLETVRGIGYRVKAP